MTGEHALGPAPHEEITVDVRENAAFNKFMFATLKSLEKIKTKCKIASLFPENVEGFAEMVFSKEAIASIFSCHFGFVKTISLISSNSG